MCDLTAVRSQSTGRGRVCSHRGDLGSGHQSSLGDTCHTEALLCCAGSSVVGRTPWSLSQLDATQNSLKGIVQHVEQNTYLLSCLALDENTNTTLACMLNII